jgi:hypothetical protein
MLVEILDPTVSSGLAPDAGTQTSNASMLWDRESGDLWQGLLDPPFPSCPLPTRWPINWRPRPWVLGGRSHITDTIPTRSDQTLVVTVVEARLECSNQTLDVTLVEARSDRSKLHHYSLQTKCLDVNHSVSHLNPTAPLNNYHSLLHLDSVAP